jgi:hypothetical protein
MTNQVEEILLRLQRWYASQCNGDWEHDLGIRIESLDNPGWRVQINLRGTPLEGREFQPIELGVGHVSSTDWHRVWVEDLRFQGAGDPSKLEFILKAFLDWSENWAHYTASPAAPPPPPGTSSPVTCEYAAGARGRRGVGSLPESQVADPCARTSSRS